MDLLVINRWYITYMNFLFFVCPCRVWCLSVFGIPLWHVVVWLCRFTQQVNFSLIWRCIIPIIRCPNYFFFFIYIYIYRSQVFFYSAGMSTGMIASLIILVFILARFLPKVRYFIFDKYLCFESNHCALINNNLCLCVFFHRKAPSMCWLWEGGHFLYMPFNWLAGTSA